MGGNRGRYTQPSRLFVSTGRQKQQAQAVSGMLTPINFANSVSFGTRFPEQEPAMQKPHTPRRSFVAVSPCFVKKMGTLWCEGGGVADAAPVSPGRALGLLVSIEGHIGSSNEVFRVFR